MAYSGDMGRIGIALGSGSARGWAHIGVLRGLEERGLAPDIVCGASQGAVVGAAYAAGKLDELEAWVRSLDKRKVRALLDFSGRGGLIKAERVLEEMTAELDISTIEDLERDFIAVATDLYSGREVWLRKGDLTECLRASSAIPGIVTPVRIGGRWLADGALVNPVPVAPCRACGADTVIAVDLNTTLLDTRVFHRKTEEQPSLPALAEHEEPEEDRAGEIVWTDYIPARVTEITAELRERFLGDDTEKDDRPPTIYEVTAQGAHIMQVRITRSRMAGDPPDLLVTPQLRDFSLLDFHRAAEAIEEGRRSLTRALAAAPRS